MHTHSFLPRFNAHSIGDDVNIFRGLDRNSVFVAVIAFTVVVQYIIVQVRVACRVPLSLVFVEWCVCVCVWGESVGTCESALGCGWRHTVPRSPPQP